MKKFLLIIFCFFLYLASTVPIGLFLYSLKTNSDIDLFKSTGFHGYLTCLQSEGKKVLHEEKTSAKQAETLYQTARGYEEKKAYDKALELYENSARLGHAPSYLALSDLYALGHGVQKDIRKSMLYLKTAADTGSNVAQFNYANKLRDHSEKKEDLLTASRYYDMAARNGITFSKTYLEQNKKQCLAGRESPGPETIPACLLAAHAGDGAIENMISDFYRDGSIVDKNPEKSQAWAVKSADNDNFPATITVIHNYLDGYGTGQNPQKAYLYYKKALENSSPQEKKELNSLYEQKIQTKINAIERAWTDTRLFLASFIRKIV